MWDARTHGEGKLLLLVFEPLRSLISALLLLLVCPPW